MARFTPEVSPKSSAFTMRELTRWSSLEPVSDLFRLERFDNIPDAWLGLAQMIVHARALFRAQGGDKRQHPTQGHGHIVNVVHQSDCFSTQRHTRYPSAMDLKHPL